MNRLTDSDDIDRIAGTAHSSGDSVTLRTAAEARAQAARRRSRKERKA